MHSTCDSARLEFMILKVLTAYPHGLYLCYVMLCYVMLQDCALIHLRAIGVISLSFEDMNKSVFLALQRSQSLPEPVTSWSARTLTFLVGW